MVKAINNAANAAHKSVMARPAVSKEIAADPVASRMVEDLHLAVEKYGVIDDSALTAFFQRAVLETDTPEPAFTTSKSAVEQMVARAKKSKASDAPNGAQEAALAHVRKHYSSKMTTGASKVFDQVHRASECQREGKPIPKALIDEMKGSGGPTAGSTAALSFVRKQYSSVITPVLMNHIDSMLSSWSMSLFQEGLQDGADQARRQQEDNARAFQDMVQADKQTHLQTQQKHSSHVGKKHEIQFAKIDFEAVKGEVAEAYDDHEISNEEVNEADQDYATANSHAAPTSEFTDVADAARTGDAPAKKSGGWQATMLNVRFPGSARKS